MPENVKKQSTCEFEFDCLAEDILNLKLSNLDTDSQIQNPGLKFIWNDEKYRRRLRGIDSQLNPPASPGRSLVIVALITDD